MHKTGFIVYYKNHAGQGLYKITINDTPRQAEGPELQGTTPLIYVIACILPPFSMYIFWGIKNITNIHTNRQTDCFNWVRLPNLSLT